MLQEIRGVRQDDASRERHWFQDDFFDLFVWTDGAGAVVAFQLGYDRAREERMLAWSQDQGFLHRRVDDGEATPLKNMSPMLIADGEFGAATVAAEFARRALQLDGALRGFILARIDEAATRMAC
jgi:hypothetical protein